MSVKGILGAVRARTRALASASRLGQFASVGVAGALLENAVLIALVEIGDVAVMLAAIVGKEAAILLMFTLNERWTFAGFGESGGRDLLRRLGTTHLVRAGGVGVALGVLYLLYSVFGVWYLLANVIGIGVGFVFNYTAESLVTWRVFSNR